MSEPNIELEKKVKFLFVALSVSVAFNLALLINFSFIAFRQEPVFQEVVKAEAPVKNAPQLSVMLDNLLQKDMKELISLLEEPTSLEEGYRVRDLALAVLSNYYYLNLDKALSGVFLQKRVVRFEKKDSGEQFEMTLFPGLNDEHFQAVRQFIRSERWPLTPEGIFVELKKNTQPTETSLKEAFYKTQHFELIELLFKRNQLNASKESILRIIQVGDFQQLDRTIKQLLVLGTFPKELLQQWLKEYIQLGSSHAATLFIELDPQYALKNLEDFELKKIIQNLKTRTDRTLFFLKELMNSIRSDAIRKEAALKLYILYKDILPADKKAVDLLRKLTAKEERVIEKTTLVRKEPIHHTIKEGDTLWQIAKMYNVSVSSIVEVNQISKNKPLQIGKTLVIP